MKKHTSQSSFSRMGKNIIKSRRVLNSTIQNLEHNLMQNELDMEHLIITENIARDLISNNHGSYFTSKFLIDTVEIQDITEQNMNEIESLIPEGKKKEALTKLWRNRPSVKKFLLWTLILLTLGLIIRPVEAQEVVKVKPTSKGIDALPRYDEATRLLPLPAVRYDVPSYTPQIVVLPNTLSEQTITTVPSRPIPSVQVGYVCSNDPTIFPKECAIEKQFHEGVAEPDLCHGELMLEKDGICFPYKEHCDEEHCKGNLGIERHNMPQVGEADLPRLDDLHIPYKRYSVDENEFKNKNFRPSQATANREAINFLYGQFLKGPNDKPIFVSNDGFIIDGHHRFFVHQRGLEKGWPADRKLNIIEIDLPIVDALQVLRGFGNKVENKFGHVFNVKAGNIRKKGSKKNNRKYKKSKKNIYYN